MSRPEIKESPGIISFDFAEEKLFIQVKRLRAHSDGRVAGELIVNTTAPGVASHLKQCLFNFAVDRSRKELAHSLESLYNIPAPGWPALIEALCVKVLEIIRRGEPVLFLDPNTEVKPPQYLLWPFILEGNANLIYGDGGSGKSTLALLCEQIIHTQWVDNPFNMVVAKDKEIKGLYLDWETHDKNLLWQHKAMLMGNNRPFYSLPYRHCSAPLADEVEQIQEWIDKYGFNFLIIDSVGMAAGGDLNKSEVATGFFKALRQLKVTSLSISHIAKDNLTKKKTPFGSQYWWNESRNIWEVNHTVNEDENRISVGLFHKKANNSRIFKPVGFEINYLEDLIIIEKEDVQSVAGFLEHLGYSTRILGALKGGAMKSLALSKELNIPIGVLKVTLSRMKNQGKLSLTEEGAWGVITHVTGEPG